MHPLMHRVSYAELFGETSNHLAPYGPDLVPCDFWLFPKLKSPLKGKRFQTIDEIQENTMGQLVVIETKDFADIFNNGRDSGRTV